MASQGLKAMTSGTSIFEAQRRAEMLRLRIEGLTLEEIGDRMGIQAESVYGVIQRALRKMTKEPTEELLALELGRCDALLMEAMRVVSCFHPLIHAGAVVRVAVEGEDGKPMRDPETGEALTQVLEDKAPKLAAITTALRVLERRSKYLGLDKPTKIASTDPTGLNATPSVMFYMPSNGRENTNAPVSNITTVAVM
jgi:hypothetical protein